jgi:hypothetical protein
MNPRKPSFLGGSGLRGVAILCSDCRPVYRLRLLELDVGLFLISLDRDLNHAVSPPFFHPINDRLPLQDEYGVA